MPIIMKKGLIFLFLFILLAVSLPQIVYAHPGRTASDGCHYCRTNCDRWEVPWNERHCHGGTIIQSPSSQSEVLDTETKGESGSTWIGLAVLGLIAGGLYFGFRKIKSASNRDKNK